MNDRQPSNRGSHNSRPRWWKCHLTPEQILARYYEISFAEVAALYKAAAERMLGG